MKRIIFSLLLFVAALVPARAEERIERFVSNVDVQRNGDLLVTETIQVWAEGRQIRRGILRDFPTTYHRTDGSRVEVGFNVQSVTRDGSPEEFSTERMTNGVRVRIGSAGRSLNTGSHVYVISYRTTRQIGFFQTYDELYWNATGTGWTFPIEVAEARINLPEKVAFKRSAFYTGPQGARGQDAIVVEQRPGLIVFRTTKRLPVANGLTVAAGFPKDVVIQPTPMQRLNAMLEDDPALKVAAIGGGLVLLFYFLSWLAVGRDPHRGTIIPLFGPPAGMSAAAVRFVHEMAFDDRVFSAAIVGLGVNGHLKLTDRRGHQELHHVKSETHVDDAERIVETRLFSKNSTVTLSKSFHSAIAEARLALHRTLTSNYVGTLFHNNVVWSSIGLAAGVFVTSWICVAYAHSYQSSIGGIFAGLFIPLIPIMMTAKMIHDAWRRGGSGGKRGILIGLAVLLVALAIGATILVATLGTGSAILPAMVPYVLAAVGSLGFFWLKAPTREGRRVMDEIDGFKQYLCVAEEDRIKLINPPERTPELFERFLPYAIALGVENRWAMQFTSVLAAAGVAAAVSSWYTGDTTNVSNIGSFTDRVSDSLATIIAAAAVPPGSSGTGYGGGGSSSDFSSGGSSGGGDSGGGGGGGGGSGW